MRSDFAIVESPFQLICALEYSYAISPIKIYVRLSKRQANNEMLLKVVKTSAEVLPKQKVFIIGKMFQPIFLFLVLTRLLKFKVLILGDYYSRFLKLASASCPSKNKLFLDDGVATLKMQIQQISSLRYFTIFDNIENYGEKIINNLTWLRLIEKTPCKARVVILGSPIVEEGLCTESEYFEYLSSVRPKDALYFPHRYENADKLDLIAKKLDFQVADNELGAEIELSRQFNELDEIYTFYSTAAFSLKKIFPEAKINLLETPKHDGEDIHVEYVKRLIEKL